jgi:NADPH2:quinone reductase
MQRPGATPLSRPLCAHASFPNRKGSGDMKAVDGYSLETRDGDRRPAPEDQPSSGEATMRSFVGTSYGPPESFVLTQQPTPEPADGQIRVRIEATALGYVDGLMMQGRYQIRPPLPYVPGGEIAGVVDAAGANVTTPAVGEPVVTWQLGGGLAEYVVVDAADVDRVPPELPLPIAAAMLVDYQTAHYALFDQGKVSAGDTVLMLGATGGVASAAVQMAARAGAYVIAAASTGDKRRAAVDLGAHAAIDYTRADWRDELKASAPGGAVDVVLDPVGGDSFQPAFRSLTKGGRYLVVGFAGGGIPSLPVNLALLKNASLVGVDIRYFLATRPEQARRVRKSLFSMVAAGYLKQPIIITFPLEQAREAVAATMQRGKQGKVVVLPKPDELAAARIR